MKDRPRKDPFESSQSLDLAGLSGSKSTVSFHSFTDFRGFELNKFINFSYIAPTYPKESTVQFLTYLSENRMIYETSYKHRRKVKKGMIVARSRKEAMYIAKIRGLNERVLDIITVTFSGNVYSSDISKRVYCPILNLLI